MLNDILDALPLPTIRVKTNGTVLFCNKVCGDFLQDPATLTGSSLIALVHADDQDAVRDALVKAATGKPTRIEVRLEQDSSPLHYALLSFRDDPFPEEPAILVQATDITAQKLLELDLASRESRWNSALINSESGVWDQNMSTGVFYGSDTWRSIRGMAPDDPIETNHERWLELIHPDDRDRVIFSIERQNAGDPEFAVFEYREKHKDGHWVWIECRGAAVDRDADGNPIRIVGIDNDISTRKAAEFALEKMSRRLKLALEASHIGVFEVDFETRQTTWDDRMYSIFNVSKDQDIVIDGVWEKMVHPEDLPRVQKNVEFHVARLTAFSDEYRIIMPDGKLRYIRARTLPFIDNSGHARMVGANWDVTDDIVLQRELERAKNLAEARNLELEEAKNSIEYNAMHDYLTELPNRRYLDDTLRRMAAECARDGQGIGILHIDLDRFKQVNDTFGHRAGDMLLQNVAQLLRKNVRGADFVARIGGDEFVFVSRYTGTSKKFSALADRLIKELRKPMHHDGHEFRCGASIGIACESGRDIDPKQLLLNADIALYNAKKRGRNRYDFFSSDTQDILINTKRVSDEILLGLERSEFIPYYQLQFDAKTLDIIGAETLARWKHPTEGILTPDRFLAIAEDLDAVTAIDEMMLEKAVSDFNIWQKTGLPIPKVSVNVSSRRLHDPLLTKSLKSLDIKPGTVSFELLESIFLDDSDQTVLDNLARLRKLGIAIEVDDFGTGHASIISLLRISPDALKIDRELVRLLPQSNEQRKLLSSILEIGRSLNIRVIAEGVETQAHIRILRDLGCDYLQGYALCRPIPAEMVEAFVTGQSWRQDNGNGSVHNKFSEILAANKKKAGDYR
jgi:diguanylate cyclase (GGDEF)-like protein/PAS domain S-box-containing protein